MTDQDRLAALERLYEVALRVSNDPSASGLAEIMTVARGIPPKPEELIQMDGWKAECNCGFDRYWCRWTSVDHCGYITGPSFQTKAEAIRAGNAMLREIKGKVP